MIGTWKGKYNYTSKMIPEELRNQDTLFEIIIEEFDGNEFKGTVEDDVDTGGMEGIGIIEGIANGSNIEFVKQMPIESMIARNGEMTTSNRKHPRIYYQGEFIDDVEIKGTWKFKWGISWRGIIPLLIVPIKGEWSMKKVK